MTPISRRRLLIAGACAPLTGLAVAACATFPDASVAPAAAGGVEFVRRGAGAPPVVLMHGLADDMSTWGQVIDPLAALTTVIAYNRFGYGASPGTGRTRDAVSISDELARFLDALSVDGPVILVGHSLGGVYAQVHARRFPDAVAGMVLVDTTVPGQREMLAGMPVQNALATAAMAAKGSTVRREFEDSGRAESQIDGLPPYRGGPVVMLTAGRDDPLASSAYASGRRQTMRRLAGQYGAHLQVVDSGHFIQRDRPSAVVEAVGAVLAGARGRT